MSDEPRKTGRPCALTPEVEEKIFSRLCKGSSVEVACQLAGITAATYYNWRKRGKDGEPGFVEFFDKAEAAMVEWEEVLLDEIRDGLNVHGDPDWRAKKAAIELRRRRKYGTQSVEVSGPDGGPVQTALSVLDQRLQSLGLPREVLQSMATPATPTITADTESPHWRDPEEEP